MHVIDKSTNAAVSKTGSDDNPTLWPLVNRRNRRALWVPWRLPGGDALAPRSCLYRSCHPSIHPSIHTYMYVYNWITIEEEQIPTILKGISWISVAEKAVIFILQGTLAVGIVEGPMDTVGDSAVDTWPADTAHAGIWPASIPKLSKYVYIYTYIYISIWQEVLSFQDGVMCVYGCFSCQELRGLIWNHYICRSSRSPNDLHSVR